MIPAGIAQYLNHNQGKFLLFRRVDRWFSDWEIVIIKEQG